MTCLKMTKDRLRNFIPLVNNESAGADHRSVPALSLSKKRYRFVKMHENNLVNALMPRGPFLFRSTGKGSKRGRFARHFGNGKMKPRTNPFGEPFQTRRFTSSQTHGKVRILCCGTKHSLSRLAFVSVDADGRPRQRLQKLSAGLVREFPRAAGKRKGFMFEPP